MGAVNILENTYHAGIERYNCHILIQCTDEGKIQLAARLTKDNIKYCYCNNGFQLTKRDYDTLLTEINHIYGCDDGAE